MDRLAYVFLHRRPLDKQAWPVIYSDLKTAQNCQFRVSAIVQVVLPPEAPKNLVDPGDPQMGPMDSMHLMLMEQSSARLAALQKLEAYRADLKRVVQEQRRTRFFFEQGESTAMLNNLHAYIMGERSCSQLTNGNESTM